MNLHDASEEDEEEEDEDEELDALGREAVEEGVESPFFGGDGVRGLTSTTLRLSADNEDDIAEVETLLDTSAGRANVEELLARLSSRGDEERGDADRERGTTSTTFNAEEEEETGVAVFDGSDIRREMAGFAKDHETETGQQHPLQIECLPLLCPASMLLQQALPRLN